MKTLRTRSVSLLLLGGLLLVAGVRLRSQAPEPQEPEQAPPIRVEVELVNVVFSVTDRRGRHVTGLGPDDFAVYEDGVRQEIKYFSNETNLPLRIGLLIDTSSSIRPRFQFEQEAAVDFLHTVLRPKTDTSFVIGFDATPILVEDYTDDPLDLADAIRELRPGGGTALYDAIYLAAKMKLSEVSANLYRKMLIVISDGNDTASIVSREEALEMARRHEVTIFTVSTSAPPIEYSGKSQTLQESCKVLPGKGDKVLEHFAGETGGTSYCPFSTIDVGQSFERIATELRSQYTLAYTPSNRSRDSGFRSLRIDCRRGGVRVHHRPGYYAQPSSETSSLQR